jgi:hypothetical protein
LRRWILPAAAALAIALPFTWRLVTVPDTRPVRTWIMREPSSLPPYAVQMLNAGVVEGADAFRLSLTPRDVSELAEHDQVELVFGTNGTRAKLVGATLAIAGTSCVFATPADAVLADNSSLPFLRRDVCTPFDRLPLDRVQLEVRLARHSGTVALWTFQDASAAARMLYMLNGNLRLSVRGLLSRTPPTFSKRRADLLAYMWSIRLTTLWTRLGVAFLLILAGAWLLQRADATTGHVSAALGIAALMGGLALAYAIVTPPLQAPDEPDHLVSYASLNGHADISRELSTMLRRTHFGRLRHQAYEQFSETDIKRPLPEGTFDDLIREPVARRSPLTAWWWALENAVLRQASLVSTLWGIRAGAALFLGASAGIGVLLLSWATSAPRPALLGLGFIIVPTLPFFGAHVSDTSTIVALNLILASALASVVLDGPHDFLSGTSLGAAMALVLLSGRRSWPVLVVAGAVLVARAAIGSRHGRSIRRTMTFWGPLLASVALGVWWAGSLGTLGYALGSPSAQVPAALHPAVVALQHPVLLVVPLLLLPLVELVGGPVRAALLTLAASRLVRRGGTILAATVVALATLSYWVDLPTAKPGAVHAVALPAYVKSVLVSMAVPFRIGHADLLLSTLFWSGYGWVDTVAPPWMLAVLNGATALAVWWTWRVAARTGDPRRILLVVALAVGLAASLAAFAAGAYALKYDLYGRYMVAWYVMLVTFLWLAPALGSRRAWWIWMALPVAAHAYCLRMIVSRYF